MKSVFRQFSLQALLLGIMTLTATTSMPVQAVEIPSAEDLTKVAQIARDKNLPIILVYSADHCTYCEILENEILKPMIVSGDYTDRVLIYKLNIDDTMEIHDFDGKEISVSDFSMNHDVFVTPTMLFLDANGNELHERILGINTVGLFGGRVDKAIELSLAKLRKHRHKVANNQAITLP